MAISRPEFSLAASMQNLADACSIVLCRNAVARRLRLSLFTLVVSMCMVSCGGRLQPTPLPASGRLVRIDWYGYECFRFRSSIGTTILVNPYSPGATPHSLPKDLRPEVLLVTNEDSKVNYIDAVDNSPRIFRGSVGAGTNSAGGLAILGVPTFPNPDVQEAQGMNIVYRWTMDGLRFCFAGNVPHALSPAQASEIGRVDILFVPAGAPPGLTDTERARLIAQLQPRVIVPMGEPAAIARWTSGFPRVHPLDGSAAKISQAAMPAEACVLLFRAP